MLLIISSRLLHGTSERDPSYLRHNSMAGDRTHTVVVPSQGLVFYRLLRDAAAPPDEFSSNRDLGKRQRSAENALIFRGISVWQQIEQAESLARHLNHLAPRRRPFRYIAAVETDPVHGHACAQTRSEGHWTIWGEPAEFSGRVRGVFPVSS